MYVCMYVCMYMHIHTYIHTCIHIHIYVYIYSLIYVHIHIYVYSYTCICMHIYVHRGGRGDGDARNFPGSPAHQRRNQACVCAFFSLHHPPPLSLSLVDLYYDYNLEVTGKSDRKSVYHVTREVVRILVDASVNRRRLRHPFVRLSTRASMCSHV